MSSLFCLGVSLAVYIRNIFLVRCGGRCKSNVHSANGNVVPGNPPNLGETVKRFTHFRAKCLRPLCVSNSMVLQELHLGFVALAAKRGGWVSGNFFSKQDWWRVLLIFWQVVIDRRFMNIPSLWNLQNKRQDLANFLNGEKSHMMNFHVGISDRWCSWQPTSLSINCCSSNISRLPHVDQVLVFPRKNNETDILHFVCSVSSSGEAFSCRVFGVDFDSLLCTHRYQRALWYLSSGGLSHLLCFDIAIYCNMAGFTKHYVNL